jgi:hypothetical protein
VKKEWVKIYSTAEIYKIEIIKAILAEQNIQAFEVNKKDSSYGAFGTIELYVQPENIIKAKHIISKQEN